MPKPPPPPKPNPVRIWLKMVMQSGALDRIPTRYPIGGGGSRDTYDYALALMAELRDPVTSARTLDAIVADALQFRRWLESRQKESRRVIMAESHLGEASEPEPLPESRDEQERLSPSRRPSPRSDPMWDDLLDGLGL